MATPAAYKGPIYTINRLTEIADLNQEFVYQLNSILKRKHNDLSALVSYLDRAATTVPFLLSHTASIAIEASALRSSIESCKDPHLCQVAFEEFALKCLRLMKKTPYPIPSQHTLNLILMQLNYHAQILTNAYCDLFNAATDPGTQRQYAGLLTLLSPYLMDTPSPSDTPHRNASKAIIEAYLSCEGASQHLSYLQEHIPTNFAEIEQSLGDYQERLKSHDPQKLWPQNKIVYSLRSRLDIQSLDIWQFLALAKLLIAIHTTSKIFSELFFPQLPAYIETRLNIVCDLTQGYPPGCPYAPQMTPSALETLNKMRTIATTWIEEASLNISTVDSGEAEEAVEASQVIYEQFITICQQLNDARETNTLSPALFQASAENLRQIVEGFIIPGEPASVSDRYIFETTQKVANQFETIANAPASNIEPLIQESFQLLTHLYQYLQEVWMTQQADLDRRVEEIAAQLDAL